MPYEINLLTPAAGPCGLLLEPDQLGALRGVCAGDGAEIVRDRNVWMQHMGSDGFSKVDLTQFGRVISQTGPSCGSASTGGAHECLLDFCGIPHPPLSVGSLFGFVGSRMGSTLQANMRQISQVGQVPESMWPSSDIYRKSKPAGFDAESPKWRLREWDFVGDFDAAVWKILCAQPVIFGVDWQGGGGHLIFGARVYRKLNQRRIEDGWGIWIRNSWGTRWGDAGHGVLYEPQIAVGIRNRYGAAAPRVPTYWLAA
jgi:hypothetical protein